MTGSHRLVKALTLLTLPALLAGACSSTGSEGDGEVASLRAEEVATLSDAADAAVVPEEDGPPTDPEEAALAFSQCMRDEGLDFPDLGVNADGNIELREGFEAIDRRDDSVRAALDSCRELLSAGGFGGGRRDALQSPEVQDGLLAYTACIRDEGFDVGDLQFGNDAGGGPGQDAGGAQGQDADGGQGAAEGDGTGPAEGQRRGGFGSIGDRFARQLALDQTDPDVAAALEACQPVLDDALAGTPFVQDGNAGAAGTDGTAGTDGNTDSADADS